MRPALLRRGYSNPVIEVVAAMTDNYQGGFSFNADAKDGPELVTNSDCEAALPTMNGVPLNVFRCGLVLSSDQSVSGTKSIKITGNSVGTPAISLRFEGGAACGLTGGVCYKNAVKVYIPSGQGITGVALSQRKNDLTFVTLDSTGGSITDSWVTLQGGFQDDDSGRVSQLTIEAPDTNGVIVYADDISVNSTAPNKIEALLNRVTNKVELIKFVNGTQTTLINEAVTYGAAKILKATKNGVLIDVEYDGTPVGTQQTVSDAGIIYNTYQPGIFGDSGQFTDYTIAPYEA